jgi:hypothetical protein
MMTTLKRDAGCARVQRLTRLALVFLLLFILATLAAAFHHHRQDGGAHHDCSVCAAGYHHSSASVAVFSISNQPPVSINEIPKVALLYNSIRVALLPCRAPPA